MRKLFFYLLSIVALALSSCEKNDNNASGHRGILNINDKNYKVSTLFGVYGQWYEPDKTGDFFVTVIDDCNYDHCTDEYGFFFRSYTEPDVGDDFATMGLQLDPPFYVSDRLTYQSGSAIMIKKDKKRSEITVRFENLKMSRGSVTLVFNGKAVVPFDFCRDL